jgi:AAA domain (dynein-related subfamily)
VRGQLIGEDTSPEVGAAIWRRIIVAQSPYAFGAALCLVSTYWSIALIVLVQINDVPWRRRGRSSADAIIPRLRPPASRVSMPVPALPESVDSVVDLLEQHDYFADRRLATSVFLALKMKRPLFLEGEAGVGKTEIAKVLSAALGRELIRLQCYEGLDTASAVYEWNYPRQMIEIRLAEAQGKIDRNALATDIFSERFLIRRPILQALLPRAGGAPVLLIDELDRTDEPFEAYLLEVLAEYQRSMTRSSAAACITGSTIRPRSASSRSSGARFPAPTRGFRARWSLSRSGCARWTCSRRRASPKRSTGPRRWWRWTGLRSTRKRSPTPSARCSSTRTTSGR